MLELPRLYVIADVDFMGGIKPWHKLLIKLNLAGLTHRFIVQIRARNLTDAAFKEAARLARLTIDSRAVLVLNGPPGLAAEFGYDGVHWPESGLPTDPQGCVARFRSAAVHSIEAIRKAEHASATALVFSPVFTPTWKPADAAGLAALHSAVQATALPVYALGGVSVARAPACLSTGAYGVATLSGVATADPVAAVAGYDRVLVPG